MTSHAPEKKAAPAVDKRGERVRSMFAGVARRYDLLNHLLSLNIDKYWRSFAVRRLPPEGSAPILDVCTGTGDLALAFDKAAGGAVEVVGADFCHEMLEIARVKNRRADRKIEFVEADAQRLPFPSDHFQIVSAAFGLRNVADTQAGLREMIRVCRPGGRVAVLEFSRPRLPILSWLYLAYFRYLLPLVGQALSRSSDDAYHYLPASVLAFPDGAEMTAMMEELGLEQATWRPLTFGIATLYVGRKRGRSEAGWNG